MKRTLAKIKIAHAKIMQMSNLLDFAFPYLWGKNNSKGMKRDTLIASVNLYGLMTHDEMKGMHYIFSLQFVRDHRNH